METLGRELETTRKEPNVNCRTERHNELKLRKRWHSCERRHAERCMVINTRETCLLPLLGHGQPGVPVSVSGTWSVLLSQCPVREGSAWKALDIPVMPAAQREGQEAAGKAKSTV